MGDILQYPDRGKPLSLKSGGGNGTSDGMEARVKALEKQFGRIDTKLDGVSKDLGEIKVGLAEVKGKLSGMPSTWQMIGIFAALVALLLAGSGVLFGVLRSMGA